MKARQTNGKAPPLSERAINPPSPATLRKYGLDAQSWLAILKSQDWVCAICKKRPKTGRFVTDHAHVAGWKRMKPEKRRLYVRGLTCWWCNHTHLGRGITEQKAVSVALYLRAFAVKTGQPTAFEDRTANAWAAYDASRVEAAE